MINSWTKQMRGFEYKWVEALDAVVHQQSFERAAEQLYISQSAVSQRIKQLEKYLAQPVLVRVQPPHATLVGEKLLGFYRRVRLLENEVLPELKNEMTHRPVQLSLAVNADSLATWLLPALQPVLNQAPIELQLSVNSESRTLDKLKSGEVVGAISLSSEPPLGCEVKYLGRVEYVCVANADFYQRFFQDGVSVESLIHAPSVSYDQYDYMHQKYLATYFECENAPMIQHRVGSSEAFTKLAIAGVAYCLIPRLQIEQELASGVLIEITPEMSIMTHIYWHHWQLESGILKTVSQTIVAYAQQNLPQ